MTTLGHAIQLEAAYQLHMMTVSDEAKERLSDRARWFAAMKRINCTICDEPIEA